MAISCNSLSKILRRTSSRTSSNSKKVLVQKVFKRNYTVKPNVKKIELRTDRPIGVYPFKHSKLALQAQEYYRQLRYKEIERQLRPSTSITDDEFEKNIVRNVTDLEITFLVLKRNDLLQKYEKEYIKAARYRAVAWLHGLTDKNEITKLVENPDEVTKKLLNHKTTAIEVFDLARAEGFSIDLEARYSVETWFLANEIATNLISSNKAWSTLLNKNLSPEVETQLQNGFTNYLSWKYHDVYKNQTVSDKLGLFIERANYKNKLATTFESEEKTISLVNKVIDKINYASSLEFNQFSQNDILHHYIQCRNYLRELALSVIEEGHYTSFLKNIKKQSEVWDEVRSSFEVSDESLSVLTSVIQGKLDSLDGARAQYPRAVHKIEEALARLQEAIENIPQEVLEANLRLREQEASDNEFYEDFFVQSSHPLPAHK